MSLLEKVIQSKNNFLIQHKSISVKHEHSSKVPLTDFAHKNQFFLSDSETLAARVLLRTKKVDLITPVHRALNWLPVSQRTDFKILLLVYKA